MKVEDQRARFVLHSKAHHDIEVIVRLFTVFVFFMKHMVKDDDTYSTVFKLNAYTKTNFVILLEIYGGVKYNFKI